MISRLHHHTRVGDGVVEKHTVDGGILMCEQLDHLLTAQTTQESCHCVQLCTTVATPRGKSGLERRGDDGLSRRLERHKAQHHHLTRNEKHTLQSPSSPVTALLFLFTTLLLLLFTVLLLLFYSTSLLFLCKHHLMQARTFRGCCPHSRGEWGGSCR
jgi:hypothetical protein